MITLLISPYNRRQNNQSSGFWPEEMMWQGAKVTVDTNLQVEMTRNELYNLFLQTLKFVYTDYKVIHRYERDGVTVKEYILTYENEGEIVERICCSTRKEMDLFLFLTEKMKDNEI